MQFNTVAEYDVEIPIVRSLLHAAMKNQVDIGGGAAQGHHMQRGNVREIREYLDQLCKEREIVAARSGGGTVNHVGFGRES